MTRQVVSREQFLTGLRTTPREDVPIPELGNGCVVPVWGMSALEYTRYQQQFQGKNGKLNQSRFAEFRQRLVVQCCRTDDGQPIFTESDVAEIGRQRADVIERIVTACQRLSGITTEDPEDAIKNSDATHGE